METAASRVEKSEDGLLKRSRGAEKDGRRRNSDNSFPFSFSFSRLVTRDERITRVLKVLGTILHDQDERGERRVDACCGYFRDGRCVDIFIRTKIERLVILRNRGIFV